MEAILVYPDDPEARKRVSENFTETLFYIIAKDFEKRGPIMKKMNELLEKEKDVLNKFKQYNNRKMETCIKNHTEEQQYVQGYTDALKEQNEILDKQLKILGEVDYGN